MNSSRSSTSTKPFQKPSPVEVANPLKWARREARLTIDQLVSQTGLSKSYIIKQEQGTYEVPSDQIMAFFVRRLGPFRFHPGQVREQYKDFQRAVRVANYGVLVDPFPLKKYLYLLRVSNGELVQHPFTYWREISKHIKGSHPNLNLISKALCVQQALLYKFEQQAHLVNSVPDPLIYALLDAGYREDSTKGLELAFHEYKRHLRNRANRTIHADRDSGSVTKLL